MLRRLAVPCALIAAALSVYWPVLFGASFALRDFLVWTLPSRALIREALLEGRLALWQPYVGLGMPAVAEPVNGVFYPPHVLLAALPLVTGVNVLFVLHVVAGGWGAYALGRVAGADRTGAVAGGVTFMLCGVTTSGWASGLGVLTGSWMPWCAAAAVHLGRSRGLRGLAPMAAALAPTALAGDPFQFLRAGILALPLAVGAAIAERKSIWRASGRLAVSGALGMLVAAAAIVPGLASLGESERQGGLPRAEAERWSLHPIRMVEMAAPGALGDPTDPTEYAGAPWLADDRLGPVPWCHSVYLGIGVFALAPLALRRRDGAGRALVAAFGVAALVGLLLALGRHTPLFGFARVVLPPLSYFRYPEKFLDIGATAIAPLVALGIGAAVRDPRAACRWIALLAGALLLFAAAARTFGAPAPMPAALLQAALFAVALALALGLATRLAWPRAGPALLVSLIAADLALAATPMLRWIPAAAVGTAPLPVKPAPGQPPPRVYREPGIDDSPAGVEDKALLYGHTLRGNLGAIQGLGAVPGYESAFSARWREIWDAVSPRGGAALRLLGVGTVLAGRRIEEVDVYPIRDGFPVLHAVRDPLPRAYLVGQTRPLGSGTDGLLGPDVVEGRVALVEDPAARLDGAPGRAGRCQVTRYQRERVDISCFAERDALLVLVEGWSWGWDANVDGAGSHVFRVNGMARGVRVGSGTHNVTMRYRPREVVAGVGLSLLGVVLLAGIGWRARRATRSGPPSPASPP